MSDLWLPPGAIPFDDDIERVIEASDDPAQARAAAEGLREHGFKFPMQRFGDSVTPDSSVLMFAKRWSRIETERGDTPLTAFVISKELERMILDGNVHYESAAMVEWAENQVLNHLCPAVVLRLKEFQTFTPLAYSHPDGAVPAPDDWQEQLQTHGFALAFDQGDGTYVYISTGPMTPAQGLTLPARSREKPGRNDKCPCGSGIKFKKCCGA